MTVERKTNNASIKNVRKEQLTSCCASEVVNPLSALNAFSCSFTGPASFAF